MKLPENTNDENYGTNDARTHEHELARCVVECFEDLLKARGINLDDPDAPETLEERVENGIGPLYGGTYYGLVSEVESTIERYLERLKDPLGSKAYENPTEVLGTISLEDRDELAGDVIILMQEQLKTGYEIDPDSDEHDRIYGLVYDEITSRIKPIETDPDEKIYAQKRWTAEDAKSRAKDRFGVELTEGEAHEAMEFCARGLQECTEADWLTIDIGIESVKTVVPRIQAQQSEPYMYECQNCGQEFNLLNHAGGCPYCDSKDIVKNDEAGF